MSMNIEGLSAQQLSDLIARANKRKKVLAKRKPANQVKAAVAKVLKASGWSFEELYGTGGATAAKAPATKRTRAAKPPRIAAWERWHRSTAIRPIRRKPGQAAVASRAGSPVKPPLARSWKIS